jgi:4-hydroxybenzoate polyprenyltransferase
MNRVLSAVVRAGFGYGIAAKPKYNFGDKVLGFLALVRPVFLIMTPLNAASAVVLGLGKFPSWAECLIGFCAVALAGAAVNSFNDYVDRERDKHIWESRSIPSGRVKPTEALIMVLVFLAASLSIAWFYFNPATFVILLLATVLGCLYSVYLRDKVGYLALPPIVGLIYLGGWAAFSPETLFTSFLPWYLYLLGVVWQAGHIMIYYPLHLTEDTGEGQGKKVPPAFFFVPSARFAVTLGVVFFCITLILAGLLPLIAPLSPFYLVLVVPVGIYSLYHCLKLLPDSMNKGKGLKAFGTVTIFRLTISVSILLVVLLA